MREFVVVGLALVLSSGALAGCLGTEGDATGVANTGAIGSTAATPVTTGEGASVPSVPGATGAGAGLGPTDRVLAPSWQVGQWFGYHVFLGSDEDDDFHYDAIVVAENADSWMLATDEQDLAKFEAMMDLPILGTFSRADLSTTDGGNPFTWYRFPLYDGATWTDTVVATDYSTFERAEYEITHTVTYNPAITTRDGVFPGFDVEARTSDGNLAARYDYVPAIGWLAHAYLYDPTSDGGDWFVHLMSMGSGMGWTGTYYIDTATELVASENGVGMTSPDDPTPVVEPDPYAPFTVSDAGTYVTGFLFSYAFAGAHETVLVDPEHGTHETQALGVPFGLAIQWYDESAIPGEWHFASGGAGVAAGGGAFVWEIVEATGTL